VLTNGSFSKEAKALAEEKLILLWDKDKLQ
jgi:HJR/Mrr/RecB family endonuclease